MTLVDSLAYSFNNNAERLALKIDQKAYRYEQIWQQAYAFSSQFASLDSAGIGILTSRSIARYTALLGSVIAGKFFVPLNTKFPLERLLQIIEISGIRALVVDEQNDAIASQIKAKMPSVVLIHQNAKLAQFVCSNSEVPLMETTKPCYIMFTSGSTGTPKGVPISYGNLTSYLDYMVPYSEIHNDDVCSQFFDIGFDLSIHDIFVTWLSGACLAVIPESAVFAPGKHIQKYGITCWFSVPSTISIMEKFGQLKEAMYPTVRKTFFCGEALFKTQVEKWIKACPNTQVINLYGPTEATIACSHFVCDDLANMLEVVPIGQPFDTMQFAIDDKGQLLISGPQVTAGYINNELKNAQSFKEKEHNLYYCSGDLVAHESDLGYLYQGRIDEQIQMQGHRVELKEIEVTALRVSDFVHVKAIATGESTINKKIVLFIEGPVDKFIMDKLKESLPAYMVPKEIHYVTNMPLNINGKIDSNKLTALWRQNATS